VEGTKYRCKVEGKALAPLLVVVLFSFLVLFTIPQRAHSFFLIMNGFVLAIWVASLLFMWPIEYTIGKDTLLVRIGVIRRRVPISAIRQAELQADFIARIRAGFVPKPMMAIKASLSTDRLLLQVSLDGKDTLYVISPDNREGFLKDLQSRDLGLASDGQGLLRKQAA